MFLLRLALLVAVFFLAACSTPDNSEPPAELTEIQNPEFVKLVWNKDSGKGAVRKYINMQPFVFDSKIYTIDTVGHISRFDASTAEVDWVYDSGLDSITGLTGDSASLVATSRNGEVVLFDYDDFSIKQRWKHQLNGEIRTRAVIDGKQVFIRTVDGKINVLDANDGAMQWNVSRRVPALSLTGSSHPIVTDDLVIAGFDNGKLVAFNRENGSTAWEHTVSSPQGRSEIERLVDLDGQFILRDNIIYISSYQGNLIALTVDNGQVLWSRKFSSFKAMDIDEEAIYLTDDNSHIWSIDRRTGSAFWKQDILQHRKLTAPRLLNDKIVVGDLQGYIHFLDKSDGRVVARIQPSDVKYIAQPEVIESKIVTIDLSGQLFVITQDKTVPTPTYSSIKFRY